MPDLADIFLVLLGSLVLSIALGVGLVHIFFDKRRPDHFEFGKPVILTPAELSTIEQHARIRLLSGKVMLVTILVCTVLPFPCLAIISLLGLTQRQW